MSNREELSWWTAGGMDTKAPQWTSAPAFVRTVYDEHGCGPEAYVEVKTPVTDDSNWVAILVQVTHLNGPWPSLSDGTGMGGLNRPISSVLGSSGRSSFPAYDIPGAGETGPLGYVIPVSKGTVNIGTAMCSGPFYLVDDEYSATFTAVDWAGNETKAPGGPLIFKGPKRQSRN